MIFHNHKTIFVHIPKAGGTSIEDMLWPDKSTRTENDLWMGFVKPYYNKYQTGGLQHLTSSQIRTEIGEEIFNRYYKFSIVRNPWDKIVSQYVYMGKREDLRKFIGMKNKCSFEKYLQLITKKEHVQWKKQLEFILDDNGDLLVDDVFKLENMADNVSQLSAKVGVDFSQLPHNNKGVRKPYREYYTNETKEIVADMYRHDIDYFDYQF